MTNFYSISQKIILTLLVLMTVAFQSQAQTSSLIFSDDFERSTLGDAWEADFSWKIVNGRAYNDYDGAGSELTTTQSFPQTSYILESKAQKFVNGYYREYYLLFGEQTGGQSYTVTYRPYDGGRLVLGRVEDNLFYPETLDETVVYLDTTTTYTFRVEKYGNGLIQVYINDGSGYGTVPLLEAIDTTYPTLGKLGWLVATQTAGEDFYVDDIVATVPAIEKTQPEKPEEDDLIKQVVVANGKTYEIDKLQVGVKQYTDRPYTITSVPSYLEGASFVRPANDDKTSPDPDLMKVYIKERAIAYVAFDPRATTLPNWLQSWTKTGDVIGTNDPGSSYFEVYAKVLGYYQRFPFPLKLGGTLAAGANMSYLVMVVPEPEYQTLEAENAVLSGAVVASNHPDYTGTGFVDYIHPSGDYIKWTVDVAASGAYNFTIKFAHGGVDERTLSISVDGAFVRLQTFRPGYSWDSWSYQGGAPVYLSAGTHKIRATATGQSGPNIDNLTLYPTDQKPAALEAPVAAAEKSNVPAARVNHGSYPNTFAQETTLFYDLAQETPVALSVYDLRGNLVKTLVYHDRQPEGHHEVKFQAGYLPDGLYVYRLRTGNTLQSGKLLLKR